jgi:hypothetical protein
MRRTSSRRSRRDSAGSVDDGPEHCRLNRGGERGRAGRSEHRGCAHGDMTLERGPGRARPGAWQRTSSRRRHRDSAGSADGGPAHGRLGRGDGRSCAAVGTSGAAVTACDPQARTSGDRYTACGERVGMMTRAAVSPVDPGAAHKPPPFPTVLGLEPGLRWKIFFFDSDRSRRSGSELEPGIHHLPGYACDCSLYGSVRSSIIN